MPRIKTKPAASAAGLLAAAASTAALANAPIAKAAGAVALPRLPPQKYLIDVDGTPLPYNADVHQQNPNLRVTHALPTSYVAKVRAHVAAESQSRIAQAAQIARLEEARLAAIEEQKRLDAASREAALSHPGSAQAEQDAAIGLTPGQFLISEATAEQLVEFARDQFGTDLDESLPINELRAEVAMLAGLEPGE